MSGDITITLTELVDGISVESTPQSITVYDGVFVDSGGGGGAVDSVNGETGVVVLTASDVGADAAGAAATAQVTAEAYTDTAIASEVTRADAAYDEAGAAAAAQAAAEAYADGISGGSGTVDSVVQGSGVEVDDTDPANPIVSSPLAASAVQPAALGTAAAADTTDFDAAGAASTAQTTAEGYTDTAIASEVSRADAAYATAAQGGKADTAVQPAGLTKAAVGLGNVDNTADSAKTFTESQVTNLTTDLAAKAPLASPALTGNPTATTQTAGNNSTRLATTAYADNAVAKQPEVLVFALGDETTAITTGTKVTFRMPFAMTLTAVRASLTTASSSGNPAVNIKESGTTIFSTTLTIDATEKTSTTAATAAVISDANLADDAEVTFIVDTAGTGAAGLKVTLIGTRA